MKTVDYFQPSSSIREDWLLLLVNAFDEHVISYTHILKCSFLLSKSISVDWFFEAGSYGPRCSTVWDDLKILIKDALVIATPANFDEKRQAFKGSPLFNYTISLKGHRKALDLKKRVNPNISKYIDELGAWAAPLNFTQIIASVASKYPEFRESMVFSQVKV